MRKAKRKNNWRKTIKNKIIAVLMVLITLPLVFIEGDGTGTLFMLLIAIPIFFAKNNLINWVHIADSFYFLI